MMQREGIKILRSSLSVGFLDIVSWAELNAVMRFNKQAKKANIKLTTITLTDKWFIYVYDYIILVIKYHTILLSNY